MPSGDRGRGRTDSGGRGGGSGGGSYRGRGSGTSSSAPYRGRGGGTFRGRGTASGGRGGGYAGRDSGGGRFAQSSEPRGGQAADNAISVTQDNGAARSDSVAAGPPRDASEGQDSSLRQERAPQMGTGSPYQARSNGSAGQPDGGASTTAPPSRGGYGDRSAGSGYGGASTRGGYEGGSGSRGGYEGGTRPSYGQQDRSGGQGMRRDPRLPPPDQGLIMNENIPSDTVRLVGANKEMLGVMSLDEALDLADQEELDVILISPDADPPVCRLVSYDKFKYEEEKAKKVQSKKQREGRVELKELKIRPNTDVHDYQVRLRSAAKFISKGNKVKLTCSFKGREIEFQSIGRELFERFLKDLGDEAVVENRITMQGRQMSMIIGKAASSAP